MKKISLLISSILLSLSLSAQNSNWENIFLTVSGHNVLDGVEAWYMKTNCNGDDVVLIKFNNTNTTAVTISWYDAFFKQDLSWVTRHEPGQQKSLRIPALSSVEGSCSETSPLKMNLNGILDNPDDFRKYSANYFTVVFE